MDDLAGLEFHPSASTQKPIATASVASFYPVLRPTPPLSGRATPTLTPAVKGRGAEKPPGSVSTPGSDSFANLLPFASSASKPVSLQERQHRRQEEQAKQEHDRWKAAGISQSAGGINGGDTSEWDRLGNSRSTAGPPGYTATSEYGGLKLSSAINKPFSQIPAHAGHGKQPSAPHDLLAALDAPSENLSHRPRPEQASSIPHTGTSTNELTLDHRDDDPFGLGIAPAVSNVTAPEEEDDVLGLLGKPISELPPKTPSHSAHPSSKENAVVGQGGPMAELVDMGFAPEKAAEALETTNSGTDVQAAVGWLLHQAHQESKHQSSSKANAHQEAKHHASSRSSRPRDSPEEAESNQASRKPTDATALPAWMRQQGTSSSPSKDEVRQSATGEKDAVKLAAELGNNLFKTANSLWKTSTKKLNQAVAEINSDSDSSQPKWMQQAKGSTKATVSRLDARLDLDHPKKRSSASEAPPAAMTDEAMMLESGGQRPRQRSGPSHLPATSSLHSSRDHSPMPSPDLQTRPERMQPRSPLLPARSKLSRHTVEEDMATAYVSPARRKGMKPTVDSSVLPKPAEKASMNGAAHHPHRPSSISSRGAPPVSSPIVSRPAPPRRHIPHLSAIALQASTANRHAGTAAFKIGNYAAAADAYTASLASLPSAHPIATVLLTNRALTYLKNGDPKASLADVASALEIIGPARGEAETIDLGPSEPAKLMHAVWGKAMTRRAEALEQLEKWAEAVEAWKSCVEAGINTHTSIPGRDRCEKAAGRPTPHAAQRPSLSSHAPSAKPSIRSGPLSRTSTAASAATSLAVARLRAANQAAERADDERFALTDSVAARLTTWRAGREGNLRALLGGLGTVLGPESGWKAIGMSELVVPARVKVAYMKGIARVHPDKLPTTATTEQIMISGAVFSTLNEAWDRFKTENGL